MHHDDDHARKITKMGYTRWMDGWMDGDGTPSRDAGFRILSAAARYAYAASKGLNAVK